MHNLHIFNYISTTTTTKITTTSISLPPQLAVTLPTHTLTPLLPAIANRSDGITSYPFPSNLYD